MFMIKCSLPSDEIKLNRLSIAHPRGLPDGLALLGFRVPGRQSAAAGDDCDALHGTPYFDMANEERHSAHSVGLRIRCAILFIVLTDFLCWVPIIVMKIWVFSTTISPMTSTPGWWSLCCHLTRRLILLYTFTTPKYRNQIFLRGWKKITSRKRAEAGNGNVATTTTGTATGSSQHPDDFTIFAKAAMRCH